MANTELKASNQEREIPKEENGGFESDDFCPPDDSDEDPTFDLLEKTRSRLSKISVKKSRPRKVEKMDSESEEEGESFRVEIPELNEKDGKCFKKVEEQIRDGHVEKLKLEQCKVYLRKYGLRLSGNKGILIDRIKEHLEVINGGGQKKYPISSFVFNCKGDACTGDVVMFEQKVYEMFSIVSRSATGPPCGTRVVAGRIVKESYGAAKQQHTFTIEVLWSTGEKPLPSLHPLLIKGRNLYRLKTMRQRWTDEEERRKVLQEKHSRGFVARCSRETRIKERETRKMGGTKRTERKSSQRAANPAQTKVVQQQDMLHQQQLQHQEKENNVILQQSNNYQLPVKPIETRVIQQQNVQHQQHHLETATRVIQQRHQQIVIPLFPVNAIQTAVLQQQNIQQKMQHLQKENIPKPQDHLWTGHAKAMTAEQHNNKTALVPRPHEYHGTHHLSQPHWSSLQKTHLNGNHPQYHQPHQRSYLHNFHHRQPLSSSNRWMWNPPRQQNQAQPRQWCPYYNEGNCYHGENCRYLHSCTDSRRQ